MKLLIDMNLSPAWIPYLAARGFEAVHWSSIGAHNAPDVEVMAHARDKGLVVFTHDLDFGVLLALTRGVGPSVLQVRTQDVMPEDIGTLVLDALERFADALSSGALVTIDHSQARARVLPLR
jgi:predicted nuclease of predicted toxin-antitoxin system